MIFKKIRLKKSIFNENIDKKWLNFIFYIKIFALFDFIVIF